MSEKPESLPPTLDVECMERLSDSDLNDLCDASESAIESGGGFGWIELPPRDTLERYWRGVVAMPSRSLYAARLDDVICGSAQIVFPPANNQAQKHAVQLTGLFIAPWARGRGLSRMLMERVEADVRDNGFSVINLDVRETMEAAVQLFEALDYKRICVHPFYAFIEDKFIQGYYYTKRLVNPET